MNMRGKIGLTGSVTDYGYDQRLAYDVSPEKMQEVISKGIPPIISNYISDVLDAISKTREEVAIHYGVNEDNNTICGCGVCFYEEDNPEYGPTLTEHLYGIIYWDVIRRPLEMIGSGKLAKNTTLILDYGLASTNGLQSQKLSFTWNKDIVPLMSELIADGQFKEVRTIHLVNKKSMQTLLKSVAGILTVALPSLKGRITIE